eukprot:385249-Lingulodinium_polyedra.AAC.1
MGGARATASSLHRVERAAWWKSFARDQHVRMRARQLWPRATSRSGSRMPRILGQCEASLSG